MTKHAFMIRAIVLAGITAAIVVATFLCFDPWSQSQDYHAFADHRTMLEIDNFLNVASNLGFLIAGLLGLSFMLSRYSGWEIHFDEPWLERSPFILFFLGVTLTALGSAYYHYAPSNETLIWDRLPMTLCFMSLTAAVLVEYVSPRFGDLMLFPLIMIGAGSILAWKQTGDLRLYGLVQFLPLLMLPILTATLPGKYIDGGYMAGYLWYALAKLLEVLDERIYALGGLVSGHTLKHVAASIACWAILDMLRKRELFALLRERNKQQLGPV